MFGPVTTSQILSRQVLSVIPTVSGTGTGTVIHASANEDDRLSASSHYTNEGHLYDATLPMR